MARSKISFSYEGIGQLLRSAGMEEHMLQRARKIKELAESRAPVYSGPGPDPHRGRYKESFEVDSTLHGGVKHDRAAATVTNTAPEAVFVEYGTQAHDGIPAMPARHILGAAMMAAAGDE